MARDFRNGLSVNGTDVSLEGHDHDHIINLDTDSRLFTDGPAEFPEGLSVMYSEDAGLTGSFTEQWEQGRVQTIRTGIYAVQTYLNDSYGFPQISWRVWSDSISGWSNFEAVNDWNDLANKPSTFPPSTHASSHTNGTDDVQSATASQKGLMTSAYASKLDGIATGATGDQAGYHDPVRVAVSTNVNTASPGASLDGVSLSATNRVLLYGQSTGTQNGIYVWNGAASAMTRATDADAAGEVIDGSLVVAQEGTHAGWLYMQTATPSGGIGSWTQTWIQYAAYAADGTTIQLSGSTFSLATPVAIASGGTNATTAAAARTNLAAITSYEATVGDGASTTLTVTHSLATKDISVDVYDTATEDKVYPGIKRATTNTVEITESVAPASNSRRVVIHGRA